MGAPEGWRGPGCALVALLAALGCRSAAPLPTPPPAVEPPASEAAVAEASPPTESEPPPTPPPGAEDVVVIERSAEAPGAEPTPSLYEASVKARAERASQRAHATRVVTDATLSAQAARGDITVAEAPPAPVEEAAGTPPEEVAAAAAAGPDEPPEEPETYWRRRVRDARQRWAAALDRVGELEDEAAKLRWDFYATDDPFYRDAQIKPAWDRALAQLEVTRQDAEFEHRELELVLEEGRRAGALPGWLREGLDLEPVAPAEKSPDLPEHRVGEPVPAEEPDGGSR